MKAVVNSKRRTSLAAFELLGPVALDFQGNGVCGEPDELGLRDMTRTSR
jgi:hypothetical protein